MSIIICEKCGKEFKRKAGKQSICEECSFKSCQYCKKAFRVRLCEETRKYCSVACWRASQQSSKFKKCPACNKTLNRDMFRKQKNRTSSYCKDCEKAWRRRWYEKNKDEESARQKKWVQKNKEHLCQKWREYRAENKETIAAKQKLYREKNRDKIRETMKQWTKNNLDKKAANESKRRAIKANKSGIIENIDREEIIARDKSICHICEKKVARKDITLDHIIPLSKGGSHTKNNIAVAHSHCNYSKKDKVLPMQLALFDNIPKVTAQKL